ncbi:tripartite tricarboxylate transporter TctB family protein [Paenibacillus sp. D51F]
MNHSFDRYAGIVFGAIGIFFMAGSSTISSSAYGSSIGANIFPLFLGGCLLLLSAKLIYDTFRKESASSAKAPLDYKRFGIIFIAAVLYALLLESVGFVITTFLFLLTGFQTMQKGRLAASILIAACFSFGIYYLYVHVLDGSLPGFPAWLGLS